jgi:Domain of unknown function (DUF5011)/HYR domain/NHL repeat/PKD domain
MKVDPPRFSRALTVSTGSSLKLRRSLPVFFAFLAGLAVLTVSATAACNFLLQFNDGLTSPRSVAVDSAGNVYVAEGSVRVRKYSSSGVFITEFGINGDVPGGFVSANKIAIDSADNVYVTDLNTCRIQKFTSTGTFLTTWGSCGSGSGQFLNGSGGIAVDSLNNVYVSDFGNHRIEKFTSTGTFISSWGSLGTGDSQFDTVQDLAVDSSDNVYSIDTVNSRVQKFTSTGSFLTKWGTAGAAAGQFNSPQGIGIDSSNTVYVADSGNNRIQKFTATGGFIEECGVAGSGDGEFSTPTGVAINAAGEMYVADLGNTRIQKFGSAAAPPVANAGVDQTIECQGSTTAVSLDGSASTAGSGSINSYTWKEGATTLGTGATLNTSLPAGSHTITLTVTDTGGGSDTDDVIINIVDTTAPVININGANPMTVECHTSFVDPGATATDGCAGSVPVTPSGTVNVDVPGPYIITYSATDGANPASANRTVNVVDTTAPVISCPANVVVTLPANSMATSMVVNYPAVTAVDSCSASVTVNSSPASGSVFPVGTTTVNATASDGTNSSSCSFTVTVQYNFTGFFSPIDNQPAVNTENAGRSIPIKFSLSGNKGLNIFAPGFPASGQTVCGSSAPPVTLVPIDSPGGSGLTYSAGSDQYHINWKTEKSWAGTCRQLVVMLNDGSIHRADFKFK